MNSRGGLKLDDDIERPTADDLPPNFALEHIVDVVKEWRGVPRSQVPRHIQALDFLIDGLIEMVSRDLVKEQEFKAAEAYVMDLKREVDRWPKAIGTMNSRLPTTGCASQAKFYFHRLYDETNHDGKKK